MRLASSPPSAEVAGTGCCKHCQQEPRKKCQLAETVPLVVGSSHLVIPGNGSSISDVGFGADRHRSQKGTFEKSLSISTRW
jgi:hypothetical protein